jgi:hypothetical protein
MRRMLFLALVLATLYSAPAANNSIGMALSSGAFEVNHSRVQGNSTLFDGNLIETQSVMSQVHLNSGVDMRLGSGTRATVYRDRLVLDRGQLETAPQYDIQARSLHVLATDAGGLARISVPNERSVLVAAVRGTVRVTNAGRVLVANIEAGKTMSFEPQSAGVEAPTHVTGCLLSKGGKLIVFDQTTNVVLEVHGAGLEKELGNRVELNGTAETVSPAVSGASQVVKVAGVRRVAAGGCAAVAKKLGAAAVPAGSAVAVGGAGGAAAPAATAGAASGIGMGTVAVIGGVAAAATLGSLAVVGALPGQGDTPAVSR